MSTSLVSPDILLLVAPDRTYRRLLAVSSSRGWSSVLRRCLLVALILGATIGIAATSRITAPLLLSLTLCWSFAVVVQVLVAAAIVKSSARRAVSLADAIDLLFLGHAPWSLWLIAFAAWNFVGQPGGAFDWLVECSALVAVAWRTRIVYAFCRAVLQTSTRGALLRTLLHQSLILGFIFLYAAWAIDARSRFGW